MLQERNQKPSVFDLIGGMNEEGGSTPTGRRGRKVREISRELAAYYSTPANYIIKFAAASITRIVISQYTIKVAIQ